MAGYDADMASSWRRPWGGALLRHPVGARCGIGTRPLVRYLGNTVTAELDARGVYGFRPQLVGLGVSARSVSMMLDVLAQVLDDAVEYGLLDANPGRAGAGG
jgi:hypothetical protein